MSSLYTPNLSANPTEEEIAHEISFVSILMESADPLSDTYEIERAHNESLQADLTRRLEVARASHHLASTFEPQYQQYSGDYGGYGGYGGGQGALPGPADNGQGFTIHDENDSLDQDRGAGSPASSFHGSFAGSAFPSPYEAPSSSKKRSLTLTHDHAGVDHSDRKRPSSGMGSPHTPSSVSSLEPYEDAMGHAPGSTWQHASKALPEAQRFGSGHYQNAYRSPMRASQQPQTLPSFGVHPQTQLPSRYSVPRFTNTPSFTFNGVNSDNQYQLTSNSFHPTTAHFGLKTENQDASASPFRQQGRLNGAHFGAPSFQGSFSNDSVDLVSDNETSKVPAQSNTIDLTGDDSSDTASDGQIERDPAFNHHTFQANNPILGLSNDMPGAFPNDPFGDLDLAYTGQQSNDDPTFGQYAAFDLNGSTTTNNQFATNHAQHVGDPFASSWMSQEQLAEFLISPAYGATQWPMQRMNAPMFCHPRTHLTIVDPSAGEDEGPRLRNPGDYSALIVNIRPDEEIPPEQREQTPRAMSTQLMEHQKLGLAWLKKMEEGTNKGGILADDMGLGKTVQALALILARPSEDPLRKTTLIVAPVALMRQWQQEIKSKVRANDQLNVHCYYQSGTKRDFSTLRRFDIVLTTFGTLSAEYKRKYESKPDEFGNQVRRPNAKDLGLLADECKWFRVIIDEAQCIKNKTTISAKAACELQSIHRLCMTGTPMMNSVDELYSLIQFLRIKPYNDWQKFSFSIAKTIKSNTDYVRKKAMKVLQALLKAILLRRTKTSLIDGKPIITIPPKHVEQQHVAFSEDEQALYTAMETKSVLTFNRYLKQGTVNNHYANILLLLLRLRQACCHPHLISDLGVDAATEGIAEDTLLNLAKSLDEEVVARLKEEEAFECPICYDGVENPTIFIPCGHNTCADCFMRLVDPAQGVQAGEEGAQAKCPNCRGSVNAKKITDYMHFLKVFMPEKLPASEQVEVEVDADTDESSEEESEEEDSNDETLNGFIVKDEEVDDDSESDAFEGPAEPAPIRRKKTKVSRKGKGKAPKKPKMTLAELKKESLRNAAAKQKYLRRLRRNWQPSAKIDKAMELINQINQNDPTEKILVFSQWTSLLDLLEVPLHATGFRYHRYDGSMRANDRADAVNDFMENPDCKIMLVSLKAGNAGLNLNKASQVIILDPFWNPYIEDQAVDRAHRMMQQREVTVHRILVPETVEDRIIALQDKKRDLIQTALDERAGKTIARLGIRELMYLFGTSDTL